MNYVLHTSDHAKYAHANIIDARARITHVSSSQKFFGLPFNIASYSLLTHMMAQQCDLDVGDFSICLGDTHLYDNHLEQARLQVTRDPLPLPQLVIHRKPSSIFDYRFEDFEIVNYQFHPHIAAKVAV